MIRILVVEDDPSLRMLLRKYLNRLGYEAETAGTGEEAWAAVQHHPERFDVFLIDLTLPSMPGDELAMLILGVQSGARILLCSGYPYDPARLAARGARIAFIQKPYLPKQLVAELRKLIGAPLAPLPV